MKPREPGSLPYWGKARPPTARGPQFHLLAYHCLDVAATGQIYLQGHPKLLAWLGQEAGVDTEEMLKWITFWLALHDLGKFATSFQNQRPDLLLQLQNRHSPKAYAGVRHDSLGELLWRTRLIAGADALDLGAESGRLAGRFAPWICAVTGHHGEPPDAAGASLHAHFDSCDEAAAATFVDEMRHLLTPDAATAAFVERPARDAVEIGRRCSWWVAGIAVLADWLGSNTVYFPYSSEPRPLLNYWQDFALPQAREAIAAAGVLPQPVAPGNHLQDIFTLERIPAMTPLQKWADSAAIPDGPQLYLLEDVTGAGKTEAALTLAYRLMAAGHADGIYVGLPTMATANAMYERTNAVARRLFAPNARPSVVLAHGRRDFVSGFRTAVLALDHAEGDPQQADETASARCAAWLADNNKKSLLASVGVGTIDQALLGVLHARHQSLRLLGLFRKVLIVDEVHACDAYMQELLEGLLQFHAAAGGSAILVSATLTSEMKRKLARAFAQGCGWPAPNLMATGYPLITRIDADGPTEVAVGTRPEVQRRVAVVLISDVASVLAEIRAALAAGRCVCWIRNTVVDAIEAWEQLRAEPPPASATLFHARFALGDRLDIERVLRRDFGPESGPEQRRGRLVIATQVVEQSLDVDFDLLVSDLAPIDRLIQRAGRMQRHPRTQDGARSPDKDQRGGARMIVFGPAWTGSPESNWVSGFFPRGAAVYPHAGQLWITARELSLRGGFSMPEDARDLIDTVFGTDTEIPSALQSIANRAEGKDWAATNIAFAARLKLETGYVRGYAGAWLADDLAPALASEDGWDLGAETRLGETTVTLRIGQWKDGACIPWCEGADAWEASSVRLVGRHMKEAVIESQQAAALASTKEALPDQGKWSILLPFARDNDGAWRAQAKDLRGRIRNWVYDEIAGLREAPASGQRHKEPAQ
ncbi:MAG: CRISPR-associated helicase Cas3' [Burkholderiales bacterium]